VTLYSNIYQAISFEELYFTFNLYQYQAMKPKLNSSSWKLGFLISVPIVFASIYHRQAQLTSAGIRLLTQLPFTPTKKRGIKVDLGPGIRDWNQITLVGFMDKTLPDILGYPIEAVAFSRFGGFNSNRNYSDFQNPHSLSYQCWYGAYVVFDNHHRQRFGFTPDGQANFQDALDALEADQRLVYQNAGIRLHFEDGRVVRQVGDVQQQIIEENGNTWHRLTGQAQTWSSYHRGSLHQKSKKFHWCYGYIPTDADHGVDDLHSLTYQGEFWMRYEEKWQASCCKFFIYPRFTNRLGQIIDKGTPWLIKAGQAALAGIRFDWKF